MWTAEAVCIYVFVFESRSKTWLRHGSLRLVGFRFALKTDCRRLPTDRYSYMWYVHTYMHTCIYSVCWFGEPKLGLKAVMTIFFEKIELNLYFFNLKVILRSRPQRCFDRRHGLGNFYYCDTCRMESASISSSLYKTLNCIWYHCRRLST